MLNSIPRWSLIFLLLFNAVGAFFGSFMLITDPSGNKLQAPLEALDGTGFKDFLIPGIILFLVNGILPLVAALGMIANKPTGSLPGFSVLSKQHWAWSLALIAGLGLFIWIVVQILLIGFWKEPPFQLIYGTLGIIITGLTLLPPVRRYFLLKK